MTGMEHFDLDDFFRKAHGNSQPVSENYAEVEEQVKQMETVEDLVSLNGVEKVNKVLAKYQQDGVDNALFKERIIGQSNLMDIQYLVKGVEVSKTVCRLSLSQAFGLEPIGSGFLVAPGLLMTNQHVIPDPRTATYIRAEFEYETKNGYPNHRTFFFKLDPNTFFLADAKLDYCLVAVQPTADNAPDKQLAEYGYNELVPTKEDILVGTPLTIIQHPLGRTKMVAFRDNLVVEVNDSKVNYTTDTYQGSSGSPVANDAWQIVALHSGGVPKKDKEGRTLLTDGGFWKGKQDNASIVWAANQGTIIDDIIQDVAKKILPPATEMLQPTLFKHFSECLSQ